MFIIWMRRPWSCMRSRRRVGECPRHTIVQVAARQLGKHYLQRYFLLITFRCYLGANPVQARGHLHFQAARHNAPELCRGALSPHLLDTGGCLYPIADAPIHNLDSA